MGVAEDSYPGDIAPACRIARLDDQIAWSRGILKLEEDFGFRGGELSRDF
jgi:hypothetical protein